MFRCVFSKSFNEIAFLIFLKFLVLFHVSFVILSLIISSFNLNHFTDLQRKNNLFYSFAPLYAIPNYRTKNRNACTSCPSLFVLERQNTPKIFTLLNFASRYFIPNEELIHGMEYRRLADSDLHVSMVCLGSEVFGSPSMIDDEDVLHMLDLAFNYYKINFIDIGEYDPIPFDSNTWGRGHHLIKTFLKKQKRDEVILSARISSSSLREKANDWYLKWTRKNRKCPFLSKEQVNEALNGLLYRLGVDYIDILSIDRPDRYTPNSDFRSEDTYCWGYEKNNSMPIEEQLVILSDLVKAGKIRYIGVSNETPWGLFKWLHAAKQLSLEKVISTNHLYNLIHRNEFESSGLPEMVHEKNLNVGVLAYGVLAGGILSGKYLDPERYNVRGPDQTLETDELPSPISTREGRVSEDWGYLSYGPKTGRANKFPDFYGNHRSVWAQWKLGELIKIGRRYGMSVAELALCWTYTRPFITSVIIGPRTIGQLKESVRALNFPVTEELENDIHEVFLRYRAPTMGSAYVQSYLDPKKPMPQHDYMRFGQGPIHSGGTYWHNYPLPNSAKKICWHSRNKLVEILKMISGYYDNPTEETCLNVRLWKERTEEKKFGEYFAVKESKLFGWDQKKLKNFEWINTTETEKAELQTDDFHFVWKGGKVKIEQTTDAMREFYTNRGAVLKILQENLIKHKDFIEFKKKFGGPGVPLYNMFDFDLLHKNLMKYDIDFMNPELWEEIKNKGYNLTDFERLTEKFWLIEKIFVNTVEALSIPPGKNVE